MNKILLSILFLFIFTAPARTEESLNFRELLGDSGNDGFERALEKRPFIFPEDHGPHPGFKAEWWYFTGNLEDKRGRKFGYELSLFRFAIESKPVERTSKWATNNIYMGHFALTDVETETFYNFERFAREGAGLAGAKAEPFRVWVEDWSVEVVEGEGHPWSLRAKKNGIVVNLLLTPEKGIVLQGDEGLSQKSKEPGNASYYYSIPRLSTEGTIEVKGETFQVSGSSWLDREWSTSALSEDQEGWDWFALQLSNGYDLMFYKLRLKNGTVDSFSAGKLIGPDGSVLSIKADDVEIEELEKWESPLGGTYPIKWKFLFKKEALFLNIEPLIVNQELDLSIRYWEGAVKVQGTHHGVPLSGKGYLEMTGYAGN
ncbi:MAG: carotenoid 1,2-hydratase [Deltaproteobacteria bacterium]|nr:carotenoid 1,2-hydratase [Deltaproteobacteria bacterium]